MANTREHISAAARPFNAAVVLIGLNAVWYGFSAEAHQRRRAIVSRLARLWQVRRTLQSAPVGSEER
jgi:hypothetical protein